MVFFPGILKTKVLNPSPLPRSEITSSKFPFGPTRKAKEGVNGILVTNNVRPEHVILGEKVCILAVLPPFTCSCLIPSTLLTAQVL